MLSIAAKPRIETVRVADLKPAPYNPRAMSDAAMAALEKSLEHFGVVVPIVWNRTTGHVVGGNQQLKILRSRKTSDTIVVVVDLDLSDEKVLNIALNSPKLAGEFTARLQPLLDEIEAQRAELFHSLRLGELRCGIGEPVGRTNPDDVPKLPDAEPKTKPGDLYFLGGHRLLCGDSAFAGDHARLLGEDRVDALVTDPPYGVDYAGIDGSRKKIANDARNDYRSWFASWLSLVAWAPKAVFFVCMSGLELHNLRLAIDDCGFKFGDYLVWVKNAAVLTRKDYNAKHEFIAFGGLEHEMVMYGWPETHRFFGGKKRTTVLEFDRPTKSDLHPTMKPVALIEQLVTDGSPSGGIVLDLFGGSGTTLIACERTGRSARLMELDPGYCDVIVARWEQFTGKKAERARQ
jgi:DNA modification methylase